MVTRCLPLVSLLLAPPLSAQAAPLTAAQQARIEAIARLGLRPKTVVRVLTQDLGTSDGRLLFADSASLRFGPVARSPVATPAEWTVPAVSIDSLWVRGSAAGKGTLIGGLAGAAGGAVGGLVLFGGLVAFPCALAATAVGPGGNCPSVGPWVVAGAAVGVLLGAAVGSATRKWKLRYP